MIFYMGSNFKLFILVVMGFQVPNIGMEKDRRLKFLMFLNPIVGKAVAVQPNFHVGSSKHLASSNFGSEGCLEASGNGGTAADARCSTYRRGALNNRSPLNRGSLARTAPECTMRG